MTLPDPRKCFRRYHCSLYKLKYELSELVHAEVMGKDICGKVMMERILNYPQTCDRKSSSLNLLQVHAGSLRGSDGIRQVKHAVNQGTVILAVGSEVAA